MKALFAILKLILQVVAQGSNKPVAASKSTPAPLPKPKAEPQFKNDSKRLKDELEALKTKNPQLRDLLYDMCSWCKQELGKDIVITMIYRTDAEQDDIYKDDAKYKVKKFKSPHQFYHAFDLRSSTFSAIEIEKLVLWVNTTYNVLNYYNWTAKCHDVGLGDHFHVQFTKK